MASRLYALLWGDTMQPVKARGLGVVKVAVEVVVTVVVVVVVVDAVVLLLLLKM